MKQDSFINILIAEDNDISRELMASILRTRGFNIVGVTDGHSAIQALEKDDIDLALVDINMAPAGGFEFVRHIVARGIDIPVIIVTADGSTDILMQASSYGVRRVLQKPVDPDRLVQVVTATLRKRGINPSPLAVEVVEQAHTHTHDELMRQTIALAMENARKGKGRPFGAIVANEKGKILGTGANGISSRVDPTAHAEVMAIRQAAEKLGRSDLSDCILYVNSEPTMMGQALILSVGIRKVYFALSHDEISSMRVDENRVRDGLFNKANANRPEYIQMCHAEGRAMYEEWLKAEK